MYRLYLLALFILLPINIFSQEPDGLEIMKKVDERKIPQDATMISKMKLIDKRGKARTRDIQTYRFGNDKQIIWFLQPANIKGSSFLKHTHDDRDDDMWIYLPKFGKIRRIASHNKKGSFMGSDFTFEDMGDRKLNNYAYTYIRTETINDKECLVVESIPNDGVITDYAKIVSWIWPNANGAIQEEYYDKGGNLKKRMNRTFTEVDGFWLFDMMRMENLKSKHVTEIEISEIKVNVGLEESLFETRSLKRIH